MIKLKSAKFAMLALLFGACSCTAVKPYQKSKLNDAEMELSPRKVQKTEMSFQTYREAHQEPTAEKPAAVAAAIKSSVESST